MISLVSETVQSLRQILPSRSMLLFLTLMGYCTGMSFLGLGFYYIRRRLSDRMFLLGIVGLPVILTGVLWSFLTMLGHTILIGVIVTVFGLTFIIYVCFESIEHLSTQPLDR